MLRSIPISVRRTGGAGLANGEGSLAKHGPLVVETGAHTGRSAKDKFIVRDATTEDTVWWGKVNASMTPEHFAALKEDFLAAVAQKIRFTSPICSADRSRNIASMCA